MELEAPATLGQKPLRFYAAAMPMRGWSGARQRHGIGISNGARAAEWGAGGFSDEIKKAKRPHAQQEKDMPRPQVATASSDHQMYYVHAWQINKEQV